MKDFAKFRFLVNMGEKVFNRYDIEDKIEFYERLNEECKKHNQDAVVKFHGEKFDNSWRHHIRYVKAKFVSNGYVFHDKDEERFAAVQRKLESNYCIAPSGPKSILKKPSVDSGNPSNGRTRTHCTWSSEIPKKRSKSVDFFCEPQNNDIRVGDQIRDDSGPSEGAPQKTSDKPKVLIPMSRDPRLRSTNHINSILRGPRPCSLKDTYYKQFPFGCKQLRPPSIYAPRLVAPSISAYGSSKVIHPSHDLKRGTTGIKKAQSPFSKPSTNVQQKLPTDANEVIQGNGQNFGSCNDKEQPAAVVETQRIVSDSSATIILQPFNMLSTLSSDINKANGEENEVDVISVGADKGSQDAFNVLETEVPVILTAAQDLSSIVTPRQQDCSIIADEQNDGEKVANTAVSTQQQNSQPESVENETTSTTLSSNAEQQSGGERQIDGNEQSAAVTPVEKANLGLVDQNNIKLLFEAFKEQDKNFKKQADLLDKICNLVSKTK